MATYILKGVDMSDIDFLPENKKLLKVARRIANGMKPAKDAKASTKHWHDWKAGDSRAINRYIRENAMLFYCESLKLKAKFFSLDLDEIFGLILEYTYTAFKDYDPKNKAELVSFHCRYAQYYVSNTVRSWNGQDSDKIKVYKKAVKLRESTGMHLRDCLVEVIKGRRSVKAGTHASIVKRAEGLLNIFKGHDSLNRKVSPDRDANEIIDLIGSKEIATDAEIEREDSRYQIDRIKRLLKKGLNSRDKKIFDLMLNGYKLERIAEAIGVSVMTAKYRRDVIMTNAARKAQRLKLKGIRLPAIF